MTIGQFKTVLHSQPFRPFTIDVADGRVFMVKHHDFVSRSPSGRTIIVDLDEDRLSVLDLLFITAFEVHLPLDQEAA